MTVSYTEDLFIGRRRLTRVVMVGQVGIGGSNPLRIQSMTNTDTRDVRGTVDQVASLAEVGCEIVRLTVPSTRDAEILPEIRRMLAQRNVGVPLVADIHFTPNAAMIAVDHVEKIRINPGNYVDKKKFEVREFSDAEYGIEVEKVSHRFRPLVKRCRERGVAMRIGTNHGSLSDRVMNRFGDTPLGMVESALEFLDTCESESYYDIVFSMKASNTQVAIQAYRLLAQRLGTRPTPPGGNYPFHIGITEAGDSEDGRIKSAIGIGALLEDGIGDTIRVSLTEHPVREVPVALELAERAQTRWNADRTAAKIDLTPQFSLDPFRYQRRKTSAYDLSGLSLGGDAPVRVELDLGPAPEREIEDWAEVRAKSLAQLADLACESIL
ncbi:MAG: (E)-4-hydroxy-3-methylbut-2-enyl-diphosphate synthase, partial [Deltaproteobacteria bacterium]|nr:(E)-4-hydroxy-3-methylbut-2-enyl-diphosphate synthase [Deltaproteobacteria bacterium]